MWSIRRIFLCCALACWLGTSEAAIEQVSTPGELYGALEEVPVAKHVVVTAHMDTSDFTFSLRDPTQSIRGNCSGAVPDKVLSSGSTAWRDLKPQQCVLYRKAQKLFWFFVKKETFKAAAPNLWIAYIYFRAFQEPQITFSTVRIHGPLTLYMEDITFQDAEPYIVGDHGRFTLEMWDSSVHCQGCDWVNLHGGMGSVFMTGYSTLSLASCWFEDIQLHSKFDNKGVIFLEENPVGTGVLVTSAATFRNVTGNHVSGINTQAAAYVPDNVNVLSNKEITISIYRASDAPPGMFASYTDDSLDLIKKDSIKEVTNGDKPPVVTNGDQPPSVTYGDQPPAELRTGLLVGTVLGLLAAVACTVTMITFCCCCRKAGVEGLSDQGKVSPLPPKATHFDVFLTHEWMGQDGMNHSRVQRVHASLVRLGVTPWFDEHEMQGDIHARMAEGIEASAGVLVFVTRRYHDKVVGRNEQDNCKFEFDIVLNSKRGSVLAVVMEEEMLDTSKWRGKMSAIAMKLYVSLVKIDSLSDDKLDQYLQGQLIPKMTWIDK